MRHFAGNFIAALLLLPSLAWSSAPAAAAQGERPEFWQSRDIIVRVVNLPDTAMYNRGHNDYLDLGYHFRSDGSGEWVGYSTKGRRESLDTIRLGMMLDAAGLDRLPTVPTRPANTATYLFFIVNGLIQLGFVVRTLINNMKERSQADRRTMRALLGRPKANRKGAVKNQGLPGPQSYSDLDPDALSTPAIGRRGLQAAPVLNAKFGRRG